MFLQCVSLKVYNLDVEIGLVFINIQTGAGPKYLAADIANVNCLVRNLITVVVGSLSQIAGNGQFCLWYAQLLFRPEED